MLTCSAEDRCHPHHFEGFGSITPRVGIPWTQKWAPIRGGYGRIFQRSTLSKFSTLPRRQQVKNQWRQKPSLAFSGSQCPSGKSQRTWHCRPGPPPLFCRICPCLYGDLPTAVQRQGPSVPNTCVLRNELPSSDLTSRKPRPLPSSAVLRTAFPRLREPLAFMTCNKREIARGHRLSQVSAFIGLEHQQFSRPCVHKPES